MTRSAELSLVHLSDVHVFDAAALRPGHLLDKRLTGTVNALLRRRRVHRWPVIRAALEALGRMPVDHLVITGDISTLGARTELEVFLAELSRLHLAPGAVTVVPGNHDAYVPELVRRGVFASVFGPYQTSDPGWSGLDRFPVVRLRGPMALIACSTAVPSAPQSAVTPSSKLPAVVGAPARRPSADSASPPGRSLASQKHASRLTSSAAS